MKKKKRLKLPAAWSPAGSRHGGKNRFSFCLYIMGVILLVLQCAYSPSVHMWEKVEITLEAENQFDNPYTGVEVWVDLKGPGFDKRCYGFWDGDNTWRVRVMAIRPGVWTWTSASNQDDLGLNGKKGRFTTLSWTDAQKVENPLRRGMPRSTKNGHAFEYADGTPLFWLADTWWSCLTRRYAWYEDDVERQVGTPEAGFKDYVRYRKGQGYNGCMVIAGFPNWTADDSDWGGGDWEDEQGNRPFFGEGLKPDLNRINPAYFQSVDKKVDYLNAHGFIPFIETVRRDIGSYWKAEFEWPESYARYIRYLCFRYQGNIVINSPIHLDYQEEFPESPTGGDWNTAANIIVDDYGWPPFGHLASANPPKSTYGAFGHTDKARWLTFHSVGNWERDHRLFPPITEMFYLDNPVPVLNNEPYYDGLKWGNDADLGSDLAAYYSRVALYGSVFSGALAGHVYGADHVWDGDDQMPEAFVIQSASQMQFIKPFLFSEGKACQDLKPRKDLLEAHKTPNPDLNMGWAYCMGTDDQALFMLYFERGCRKTTLSAATPLARYALKWFNTRIGRWVETKEQALIADAKGRIHLPEFPGGQSVSETDWALKLKRIKAR